METANSMSTVDKVRSGLKGTEEEPFSEAKLRELSKDYAFLIPLEASMITEHELL